MEKIIKYNNALDSWTHIYHQFVISENRFAFP